MGARQSGDVEHNRRPGATEHHGPVATAVSTSTVGNSTAFGFSITITASFGAVQAVVGNPTIVELLLFAIAAAVVVAALEGAVTRGFRVRVGTVPPEVAMLGTAQNVVSITLGIGAAAGIAALVPSGVAWPAAGGLSVLVFLLAESGETFVAQRVQKHRGDPDAEEEEPD